MTSRIILSVFLALTCRSLAFAQTRALTPTAQQYVDPVNGLSLDDAIARALAQEPSLRSARSEIEVARGMRQQAALRANPTVLFEHRDEPSGTDSQTTIGLEWPMELFRRGARVAEADRDIEAVQVSITDRERLLRSEVRTRYGDVLVSIRNLAILDELVATIRRQYELLQARVEQGATPPLERNLIDVELQRVEADRLLQTGRVEAAFMELKRALGMTAETPLAIREGLETVVQRDSSSIRLAIAAPQLESRPDVRNAAARVAAVEARIERIRAEARVDISVFANYMRMDAGFPQQGFAPDGSLERVRGQFHYLSAGARISLPVLNRNQGEIAAAQAERAGAQAAHEAVRLSADAELASSLAMDERARQALTAYAAGAQKLARENLAVVTQSYELGRMTVFDVLAEQRRYLEVERAYTDTLKAAYDARTSVNRAMGGVQ